MTQPLIGFKDGASLPQLGLGVWQAPDDEAAGIVQAAVYQNEAGVGAGLARAEAGAEVAVTTKLWNESQGYDRALRAFDKSLQRLGRDSVDLYLIMMVTSKSANPERLRQNFDVFDFKLDAEDPGAIAALDDPDGRIGPDPLKFG